MKLLIACGNSLRQDDGAGIILADGLAAHWQAQNRPFRTIQVQQLVPELALDIAAEEVEEVWFVDSRVAQDEEDTAVQIRPLYPDSQSPAIGHQLSPEMLLLYARKLFDKRPSEAQPVAWQVTIPGFHFGHSETVSATCQAILDKALNQIGKDLDAEIHR